MLLDVDAGDIVEDVKLEGVESPSGDARVSSIKASRVGVRASGRW